MTAEEFVKAFYMEKKSFIDIYFNKENQTDVSQLIDTLKLDESGNNKLIEIIDAVLRDAFYAVLLGLDGEAQIGGIQENYTILDENNNILKPGEIEAFAWEYYHNNKFEKE